ncbi:carbohydrate ABC transporter substrate-binding protein [Streptomyces sp. NPDC001351]|uniref:carbohydrate ABC transporter substrate-binding protein n=1 Tax=Streptomyces sp. NPDC001351 TaxID=3364564 RepID=UPI0036BE6A91
MTRRFKVLVFVVVLLLTAATGIVVVWAEQDDQQPVTILGTWTGTQEKQFKEVLRGFGIPFRYQGTAAQREVLLSKVQSGEPPDIVIMPGIGELAEYADQKRLKRLNGLYDPQQYGSPWSAASGTSQDVYWVPVKADLKSIVWYRKGHRPTNSPARLQSWCIGMGDDGASGWPGTDWIEDLVLQHSGPDVYGKWALGRNKKEKWWTSAPLRDAWEAWARPFRQNRAAAAHALLTDHRGDPDSHGLLFGGWGGCALEHQGSFARSFYGEADAKQAELMDSAPLLPGGPDQVRAHEVTGDFAALFSDRRPARDLIERLASKEGQQQWAKVAHVFSANRQVRPHEGQVEDEIAERLTGDGPRCLDASDVMAPAVRDAFYEAVLLTLARAAADQDPHISLLLKDLQAVQSAQPGTSAAPKTVCSTQ